MSRKCSVAEGYAAVISDPALFTSGRLPLTSIDLLEPFAKYSRLMFTGRDEMNLDTAAASVSFLEGSQTSATVSLLSPESVTRSKSIQNQSFLIGFIFHCISRRDLFRRDHCDENVPVHYKRQKVRRQTEMHRCRYGRMLRDP